MSIALEDAASGEGFLHFLIVFLSAAGSLDFDEWREVVEVGLVSWLQNSTAMNLSYSGGSVSERR